MSTPALRMTLLTGSPLVSLAHLALVGVLLMATRGYAWGERGHQIVARVAARLAAEDVVAEDPGAAGAAWRQTLLTKELMLAHLANVPDIVWRGLGKAIEDQNAPTHYVDLEFLTPVGAAPTYATLPKSVAAAEQLLRAACATPGGDRCPEGANRAAPSVALVGTAPWRVAQLFTLMRDALGRATKTPHARPDAAAVDAALLAGGLLAHFVGDLGQPFHGTRDYNGWANGHGGIHAYFETEIVDSYDLALEDEVLRAARTTQPLRRVVLQLPLATRRQLAQEPFPLALALALDSYEKIAVADAIDGQAAILKPSRLDKGLKLKAERRPAAAVRAAFHDLIVERLATAAAVLGRLWTLAWEQAGRPDLSGYQSYAYPTTPAFVAPDYLGKTSP